MEQENTFSSEVLGNPGSCDLQVIQELLTDNNIDHRIVGSIAVDAYTSNSDNKLNTSDIDIIIARNDLSKTSKLLGNKGNTKIDFGYAKHIDFRPTEELSYLTHKDLAVPVKSALFESTTIKTASNAPINTIHPQTLFHTFAVVGGILRSKDWKKILPLGRHIREIGDESLFKESDFDDFHQFLKLRKDKYPNYLAMRRITQFILRLK